MKLRLRLGTKKYADKFCVHNNKKSLVSIKKSKIPNAGIGLIANKFIKKGWIITKYYGYTKHCISISSKNKYIINTDKPNYSLVGVKNIKYLNNKGMAQLANDSIHKEITGLTNNSYFRSFYDDDKEEIYLVATRDILQNEEILTSYGLDYWVNEILKNKKNYPLDYINWIKPVGYLLKLLENLKHPVYEYKYFNLETRTCYFSLYKHERVCVNNKFHKNENFCLQLEYIPNLKIYKIYYKCIDCNTIKLIDTYTN